MTSPAAMAIVLDHNRPANMVALSEENVRLHSQNGMLAEDCRQQTEKARDQKHRAKLLHEPWQSS